jgi:hypothetical protein
MWSQVRVTIPALFSDLRSTNVIMLLSVKSLSEETHADIPDCRKNFIVHQLRSTEWTTDIRFYISKLKLKYVLLMFS